MKFIIKQELKFNFDNSRFFFSILSKQVEHNKCPFLTQKVLVDLSISFLQIKHLNIGDINKKLFFSLFYQHLTCFLYFKSEINDFISYELINKKDLQNAGLFDVCKISKLRFNLEAK